MTTEQKNRIASLRSAGYGYTAVARELGLTKSAVCSYCHKVGLAGVMEKQDLLLPESRVNVTNTKGSGNSIIFAEHLDPPNRNAPTFCDLFDRTVFHNDLSLEFKL